MDLEDNFGTVETRHSASRPRADGACDACRVKKIRCDFKRPVCLPCLKRDGHSAACHWSGRRGRGPARRKDSTAQPFPERAADRHGRSAPPPPDPVPDNEESGDSTRIKNGPANAMMGLMEEGPFQSPTDISGSSMASFTQEIRVLVDQQSPPVAPSSNMTFAPLKPSHPRSQRDLDYVLPPRQKADHLLNTYWKIVDVAYPYVDKEDIDSRYPRLWTGEDLGDDAAVFICLLNAMFGVASLVDPQQAPEERVARGKVFYERAGSSDIDLVHTRSLLTVQCFLLLGHYAHSPQACWMFVGLAIRAAQSLGLDHPSATSQITDPRRRNLLRRIFHGCVLIDRTLSMIYGQPTMITSATAARVPHPAPHRDDAVYACCKGGSGSSEQREPQSVEYHYFIESIKLYALTEEFVSTSRHAKLSETGTEEPYTSLYSEGLLAVQSMLQSEGHLWLWNQNLPPHLQKHSSAMRSPTHTRQSTVLWVRSLHFRMLLFRPVLLRLCSQPDVQRCSELTETLWWGLAVRGSIRCVETAVEIIDFFQSLSQSRTASELDSLLPSWWYNTFYIYSAAWVIVAAPLQPAIMEAVTKPKILEAYNAALTLLHEFERWDPSVKRYIAVLKNIFARTTRRDQGNLPHSARDVGVLESSSAEGPSSFAGFDNAPSPSGVRNGGGADSGDSTSLFAFLEAESASFASFQQGWPESLLRDLSPIDGLDTEDTNIDSSFIWPGTSI